MESIRWKYLRKRVDRIVASFKQRLISPDYYFLERNGFDYTRKW